MILLIRYIQDDDFSEDNFELAVYYYMIIGGFWIICLIIIIVSVKIKSNCFRIFAIGLYALASLYPLYT